MKDVLVEMKAKVGCAKAVGKPELDLLVLARLLSRYNEFLAEGYRANPPPVPSQQVSPGKAAPRASQTKPGPQSAGPFLSEEVRGAPLPP